MIAEKSLPRLRWWLGMSDHIFCDRRLGNIDTEFQKFTVNSGRTPYRVVTTHDADQVASFLWNAWTSRSGHAGFSRSNTIGNPAGAKQ